MNHIASGSVALALTDIMQAEINLAVWERQANPAIQKEIASLSKSNDWRDLRLAFDAKDIPAAVQNHFQDNAPALQEDVLLLTDMFQCLFDADSIAIRLVMLNRAMCPRFHTDKIPCRLVSTYHGAGTEWLEEASIERTYLGRGAMGKPDHSSGLIKAGAPVQQLAPWSVALLKGDAWPENEGRGIVHRSPAVLEGDARVLITLDFA